jgi:hypothetical protein
MTTPKQPRRPDTAASDYDTRRATRTQRLAELAKLAQPSTGIDQEAAPASRPSRAPVPLEPVRSSGPMPPPKRPTPAAPDWDLWLRLIRMKLWQAVALTLNIDPYSMRDRLIPDTVTRRAFDRAIVLAVDACNYSEGPIWPAHPTFGMNKELSNVKLRDVAAYAIACKWWAPIPKPIRALVNAPQAAPVAAAPAGQVTEIKAAPAPPDAPTRAPKAPAKSPAFTMTKHAMVQQHKHEWPTIEQDIKDAKRNGLSDAAKAGTRGWDEDKAMNWARSKAKITSADKPAHLLTAAVNSMAILPTKRHRLEG